MSWNEIQASGNYEHDLLRRVIDRLPGTKPGADALIQLLREGPCFDYGEVLNSGTTGLPAYRAIIRLLASPTWHKLSDPRSQKLEAQAYETCGRFPLLPKTILNRNRLNYARQIFRQVPDRLEKRRTVPTGEAQETTGYAPTLLVLYWRLIVIADFRRNHLTTPQTFTALFVLLAPRQRTLRTA